MYDRKINDTLLDWKNNPNKKPLIIKGCRQCGKTSSVMEFANKHYPHVVYLNFHEHREYKSFFAGALDVETISFYISAGV